MLRFVRSKSRYFSSTTSRERVFGMAENWIRWDSNKDTKMEMKTMLQSAESNIDAYGQLEDAMNRRLTFGTAGLRGQMGPGYGKMNELTVLQATDGLCTYLVDVFGEDAARERGIVIGYDHRAKGSLSSERFASLASKLASSRGFRVYKYSDLVATPLVPYGVINKNSLAGVMITASHNPGQDNGYKVYWENGAQIIPPHDRGIAERIDQSRDNWSTRHSELSDFGVFDDGHINCTKRNIEDPFPSLSKSFVHEQASTFRNHDVSKSSEEKGNIVYTAMHGVGYPWIKKSFEAFDLPSVIPVAEQVQPDPTFPTVKFPNPEEGADSLNLAFETAERNGSSLVLANDPDADRLAVAERDLETGNWRVFTGNEIGTLLGHYEWKKWRDSNPDADPSQVSMLASVVSSTHLGMIAKKEGFHFEQTLTGFKWMGNRAEELLESNKGQNVLFAFEEAIGFCVRPNDFVRDKDGVTAAAVFAEMYLDLCSQDLTVSKHLENLGDQYGYCLNRTDYVLCEDSKKIDATFERLRRGGKYWTHCGDLEITAIRDLTTGYNMGQTLDPLPVDPSSHMITYVFDHGKSQATLRTSGTEPKVKCYVEVRGEEDDEKTLRDRCDHVFSLVFGEMLNIS